MKNKIYVFYPVLFLFLLFLLDKIFYADFFKNSFLQTGNVVYYKHREILFEKFANAYKSQIEKKFAVAFGDSRAYAYSDIYLTEPKKKEWVFYNFSGPQAIPAYSLQWIEKFVQNKIQPDLIFFIISPEGFDDSKGLYHKPFMRLGAEDEFISKHWTKIPYSDRYEFLLDKLFRFRAVEFDYKLLLERLSKGKLDQYSPKKNLEMNILNMYRGEQLAYASFVNDEKRLKEDSKRMSSIYLRGFKLDETQFYYVEEFLKQMKNNKTKVFVIWPRVYEEYRKELSKLNLSEKWETRIIELTKKYNAYYYNLNLVSNCDSFYDASHQSVTCYKEQVDYFLNEYAKVTIK